MGVGVIGTDTYNRCASGLEGGKITLEATGLQGATAGEIPGIEVEHQPAATESGQFKPGLHYLPLASWCDASQAEIWRRLI